MIVAIPLIAFYGPYSIGEASSSSLRFPDAAEMIAIVLDQWLDNPSMFLLKLFLLITKYPCTQYHNFPLLTFVVCLSSLTRICFHVHSYWSREGKEQFPKRHRKFRLYQTKAHGNLREEPSAHKRCHRGWEDCLNPYFNPCNLYLANYRSILILI